MFIFVVKEYAYLLLSLNGKIYVWCGADMPDKFFQGRSFLELGAGVGAVGQVCTLHEVDALWTSPVESHASKDPAQTYLAGQVVT